VKLSVKYKYANQYANKLLKIFDDLPYLYRLSFFLADITIRLIRYTMHECFTYKWFSYSLKFMILVSDIYCHYFYILFSFLVGYIDIDWLNYELLSNQFTLLCLIQEWLIHIRSDLWSIENLLDMRCNEQRKNWCQEKSVIRWIFFRCRNFILLTLFYFT
jgi:hypothetical protein